MRYRLRNLLEKSSSGTVNQKFLYSLATYRLPAAPTHRLPLILARGLALDFDNRVSPLAIINGANFGCLVGVASTEPFMAPEVPISLVSDPSGQFLHSQQDGALKP
jgi:hypothetical protein